METNKMATEQEKDRSLHAELDVLLVECGEMTVGERYTDEGQQKLDRISELRDILNLWK